MKRCAWASREPLIRYHDEEWGTPNHDERSLFEFLVLEGAQAGLSWDTILRKRAAYRRAFARFDPKRVARFGPRDVARLMRDAGIVRNRLKIDSAIGNAKAFLEVGREHGSFDTYVWQFSDPKLLSRDLKKRGFRFVGPTICEAFMEAVGILDHHEMGCDRGRELLLIARGEPPATPQKRDARRGRRAQREEGGRREG